MAGQMSFGSSYNNAGAGRYRDGRAFGEGVMYRASGTAAAKPKANNPLDAGSEAALAWNLGWDLAEANAGGTISKADLGSLAPVGVISA